MPYYYGFSEALDRPLHVAVGQYRVHLQQLPHVRRHALPVALQRVHELGSRALDIRLFLSCSALGALEVEYGASCAKETACLREHPVHISVHARWPAEALYVTICTALSCLLEESAPARSCPPLPTARSLGL